MLIDVFNGDADGLCALHQLRLAHPARSTLVTGVKRDIHLLRQVQAAAGDQVTVLDVSLDENRADLLRLLAAGAQVRYFDHHFAGEIPRHASLEIHIDPAPEACTSLLMDRWLKGAYRAWAVTAAFGDNLHDAARRAAEPLHLTPGALADLQALGELLNYNGYGDTLLDLHFHPAELYEAVKPYADPLEFFRESPAVQVLERGQAGDLAQAQAREPLMDDARGRVFHLPNEPWARRVQGVFANRLANDAPDQATALIVDNPDGTLKVSVRAPLARRDGADTLCRPFPTGGGRSAAAGINRLPPEQLPEFLAAFQAAFGEHP
jgi:hypothetical protein